MRFQHSVFLLALDEIQRLGRSLLDSEGTLELKFGMESHMALVEEANESAKICEYQEERGRDLFCVAVLPAERVTDPKTHDATGRTSRTACETICTLPDSRLLCSGFMHVGVEMLKKSSPYPIVGPRVCDAGQDAAIMEETKCTPGGHSCWRRVFDIEVATGRPVEERGVSDVHRLSDREAARRYGEKAVGEAYAKISSAVAAARGQPMMALHRALPEAVRFLSSKLIDVYAALPEAAPKAGRDEFIEMIQQRVSAFIESCNATYGRVPNATSVAHLALRVGSDVVPSIPHEFDLAVWEKSQRKGVDGPLPSAPERKKDQKLGVLDSRTDHYESDFKNSIGVFGVSVIFGDLDDFKAMNTRFGNPVVDDGLLIPLQGLIRAVVEGRGFVYAEGGDEFAIILPNTNTALAEAFLEELLRQIRGATFEMKGEQVTVTASAGIASSRSPDDWKACREAAALANNAAKKAGKDRYLVSEMRI